MWVGPRERRSANQRSAQRPQRYRLGFTEHIATRVENARAWSFESALAYLKLRRYADRGKSGHRDRSCGNASTTIRHFETEAVREGIPPGFVHFDNDVLGGLIRYRPPCFDFGPIENPRCIEAALRGQEISFRQRH